MLLDFAQTPPAELAKSERELSMQYLHTMVRVKDLDASLDFYCDKLGLKEVRRMDNDKGRFTLVFLAAPEDEQRARADQAPLVDLTHTWASEDYTPGPNFRTPDHLAADITRT